MSDDIDIANRQAEAELVSIIGMRKKEGPKPTGVCLFCGSEVTSNRRWCDADCRDDWEQWVGDDG